MTQTFSKCFGDNCQLRSKCLRYTAVVHGRDQKWLTPRQNPDGTCEDFWRTGASERALELQALVEARKKEKV